MRRLTASFRRLGSAARQLLMAANVVTDSFGAVITDSAGEPVTVS